MGHYPICGLLEVITVNKIDQESYNKASLIYKEIRSIAKEIRKAKSNREEAILFKKYFPMTTEFRKHKKNYAEKSTIEKGTKVFIKGSHTGYKSFTLEKESSVKEIGDFIKENFRKTIFNKTSKKEYDNSLPIQQFVFHEHTERYFWSHVSSII